MKLHPIPLITALLLSSFFSSSQDRTLFLKSGSFVPEKNISAEKISAVQNRLTKTEGKSFVIIQFESIPTDAERKQLHDAGIDLLDYIPNNAYTATITATLNSDVLQQVKARAVIDLAPEQKMDLFLAKQIFPSWAVKVSGTVDVWISFPKTFSYETVSNELQQRNFDIISSIFKNYRVIALRVPATRLNELASFPFIEFVQTAPHEDQPINHQSVPDARANVLNSLLPGGRRLRGDSVVIGVGDNADPLQHIDFSGRLINRTALAGGAHGVHVMGTTAGAGIVLERFHGYAPKATILSQAFTNILTYAPTYVQDYGMVITNNSYGNVVGDCNFMGVYDLYSRIMDQMALDFPNLENVFAAGNDGGLTCGPYPSGFKTVLSSFQSAKNVITVGATTQQSDISSFSARGPVIDGRIKPEITALGSNVVSTIPINSYVNSNGTSFSSPAIAGGSALLYQRYHQLHGNANPKNALIKALLLNGATDLGNSGPDFTYGFGWLNLLRSVQMLENNNYFNSSVANNASNPHSIVVPSNTAQLKVMLYWNDAPANILSGKSLVNDLDLQVTDASNNITLPKILDTIPSNVNNVATTGADHTNNVEQVVIDNPVAGNYSALVKGYSVTQNSPQEYFVVYDVVPISTTITHPIGGEHFKPGDSIYISWDSWGDPANSFSVQYSIDNGATWIDINTNVAANLRQLKWFIPSVITDQAKVRVTRNSTTMTSMSAAFTILDVPVLSLSATQCEGYIALNWTAVSGATDYEVMMLRGDDMASIGTTTSTNYTISGLSKDTAYWVSVRARLNGNPGRRAQAISRQPNNGTCAGNISDNDLKMDAILSPLSGRKFTSTELSSSQIISVRIKNLDDVSVNNFNLSYSVNGGAWTTESVNTPVAGGATFNYNFSASYDFSAIGNYTLRVAVTNTSAIDPVSANDTLTTIIKQLSNPTINLSTTFIDDLESTSSFTYYRNQTGLSNLDRYDFITNTSYGRIRSFINSGIAYSGSKALTLDCDRYNGAGTTDSLTATFNLSSYNVATDNLRLDFRYKNHGQVSNPANKVWIRGDDTKPWILAYDLFSNQNDADGTYKLTSSIELTNLINANSQNFSSSFQVRWGQWGQILAADDVEGAGYTFDDIRLYRVTNDIQMISIDTPMVSSCGLSNATPIKITVRNSMGTAINNIPVKFQIDGGSIVTENISSISANTTIQYTFTNTGNLSSLGDHTIVAYVDYPGDSFRDNDTAKLTIVNSPVINSFPYLENFENGNGNWYSGGKNDSWQYGTPASTQINRAASGSKAWKTNLAGHYNDMESSYLYSPCFDVSSLTKPTLSFSVALDLEDCGNSLCDGAYLEYSTDGVTWNRLGAFNQGTNWYNKSYSSNNLWSVRNYTRWHVATIPLPTGLNRLRLRFVMSSDESVNWEGIAVDDIHVYDSIYSIYDGPTMVSPVTQNISGGNTKVDFISGGKIIASVLPNNQNMGNTDLQAYINTSGVRNFNGQYYHDRNITVKPATKQLSDSVRLRIYFLDSESEALIAGTGCGACSKPASAYDLGISKYSDSLMQFENGSLTDDSLGVWNFISPSLVTKVPYLNGYYAECSVNNFSEFWMNAGGSSSVHGLRDEILSFSAKKVANENVQLDWTMRSEFNIVRYEIEVARNSFDYQAGRFSKIGEVIGAGNTDAIRAYSFVDTETGKSGVRYYRIKIIYADGGFNYSVVRSVVFYDGITLRVYPNPSTGIFNLEYQLNAGQQLYLNIYDANGRLMEQKIFTASGFLEKQIFDFTQRVYPKGVYLFRLNTDGKQQAFRVAKL